MTCLQATGIPLAVIVMACSRQQLRCERQTVVEKSCARSVGRNKNSHFSSLYVPVGEWEEGKTVGVMG